MVSTGTEKEAETGQVLEQGHTISRSQEQGFQLLCISLRC